MKLKVLAVVVVVVVAGCGGGSDEATPPAETSEVRVYLLRDGKVWPALRQVPDGKVWPTLQEVPEVGDAANVIVAELLLGPNQGERELGFTTAIPPELELEEIAIGEGAAQAELSTELSDEALAQIVYTLTQLDPVVRSVEFRGRRLTRGDFEDLTPAILVESPLPFEEVESPLRVTGTANTFEANFQYELTDTDGRIVDDNFVTATSGTGTRGTFEFTTEPFTVPFDGVGMLIVFESSAKDGSRINLVEIPLRMTR